MSMENIIETPLTAMPAKIVAGDSVRLSIADLAGSYPAGAGYAASLLLSPAGGGAVANIAASGGVDAWLFHIPAASSVNYAPGQWRWTIYVQNGADRASVLSGFVHILPNPASADTDSRSHSRRVLDAIEAQIENRASAAQQEVTFADGRSIKYMSHEELLKMHDVYARRVAAEERRRTGSGPARVVVSL